MRKMQIYMDYNTFEVFINDGKYVFSSRIYPNETLRFMIDVTSSDKYGRLEMYSLVYSGEFYGAFNETKSAAETKTYTRAKFFSGHIKV